MKTFTFEYPIRLDDLDYMGIVGNAEWITLLTRARIDLLEKIEFPFSEMMKQKVGGVVAELNIKFLKPAFFGDHLKIEITPDSPFKKGLKLKYSVANQKNETCLTGETKIIFVDASGRPTIMPEKIAQNLFGITTESVS